MSSEGRMFKDLHPRHDSEFSERDWETGWVHPEIRAYAWKMDGTLRRKHAVPRGAAALGAERAVAAFGTVGTGRRPELTTICGYRVQATGGLDFSWQRIAYFNAERCEQCLELIGAPEYGPVKRRKRGARPINVEFNRPTDPDVIARHPIHHDQDRRFA